MVKSTPILELDHVGKSYGRLTVLTNISLKIYAGESVSIVGPSGSGKSTLLHVAGLMDEPTEGLVTIENSLVPEDEDEIQSNVRLNSIGFLFQFHHLLPDFNTLENVLIPCQLAEEDQSESRKRALSLLKRLGLGKRLDHRPNQLSGGEQQRVALARALIRRPKILLCDEPTGNLDSKTGQVVMDLISKETKQQKIASIIVTHNEKIAKRTSSSYYLDAGVLKQTKGRKR